MRGMTSYCGAFPTPTLAPTGRSPAPCVGVCVPCWASGDVSMRALMLSVPPVFRDRQFVTPHLNVRAYSRLEPSGQAAS